MALTRIINVTAGNYRHELWVEVTSQDIGANQSTVAYEYRIVRTVSASSGAYSDNAKAFRATINGVNDIETKTYDFRDYITLLAASGSRVVTHTSDGTKTIATSIYGPDPAHSIYFPTASGSANYTLPTIPRASTPTFEVGGTPVTSVDAGTSLTIQTNRASTDFTHDITYSFGSLTNQSIATGVGASTSWTPPLTLLNQIPNSLSGVAQIKTVTKQGTTVIGEKTVNLTITVGAGIVPDIGTVTHAEATVSPDVATIVGGYVQGVSKLSLDITGEAGAYGSTIVSQRLDVAGQTFLTGTATTAELALSGTYNIRGTVTDSRGRSYFEDVSITVLPYAVPNISAFTVARTDVGGTASPTGTYLRVDVAAAVSSLIVGTQKNNLTWRVKTRLRGTTTDWSLISPAHSASAGAVGVSTNVILSGYATSDSYDVRLEVEDNLGRVSALVTVLPTGGVLMHWSPTEDGVGVGKFHEQGSIDALGQIYQNNGKAVLDEDYAPDAATETAAGVAEIATTAEVDTGTDDERFITPAKLVHGLARSGGMRYVDTVYFTSSGTFSKGDYPWLRGVKVTVQGGGGAGGGAPITSGGNHSNGAGGGSGGMAQAFVPVSSLASSVTVTVGAGGTGDNGNGNNGGTSSFGTHASAKGGYGGSAGTNSALAIGTTPGGGGEATAGQLLVEGQPGGMPAGYATLPRSGFGGSSAFGGGGRSVYTGASGGKATGQDGTGYGAGGSGAGNAQSATTATAGGSGSSGIVIVELYA